MFTHNNAEVASSKMNGFRIQAQFPNGKNWLRGRDLNPRSRSRGIMSVASPSSCRIHFLLFVALANSLIDARHSEKSHGFANAEPKVLFPWSTVTSRNCVGGFFARGRRLIRCKIALRGSEERRRDSGRHPRGGIWLRGRDLNPRPSGYEPDELPGCSTPRLGCVLWSAPNGTQM